MCANTKVSVTTVIDDVVDVVVGSVGKLYDVASFLVSRYRIKISAEYRFLRLFTLENINNNDRFNELPVCPVCHLFVSSDCCALMVR